MAYEFNNDDHFDMKSQMMVGKIGENLFLKIYGNSPQCEIDDLRDDVVFQDKDVDFRVRQVKNSEGNPIPAAKQSSWLIEVKTDLNDSGNVYVETEVVTLVKQGYHVKSASTKIGWLYGSKAKFIFYYYPATNQIFRINRLDFIEWLHNYHMGEAARRCVDSQGREILCTEDYPYDYMASNDNYGGKDGQNKNVIYQNAYGDLDLNALPTATDISNDPEMAYKAITGKGKRDATEADCLSAIIQRAAAGNVNSGANGFHYVESPLIQAIRNGWVCEIQEPTVIAKPGVLVGLNGLLDSTSAVNLPTGETIRRHPDAVIIATTNISYEGCRDMNQSVLSRFQIKMDIHAPEDTILAERLRSMTGCPKSVRIPQILKAYHAVLNTLKTLYLTDGSVDLRTLADWISSYMITGSYMESAEMTIIPSATADEEGINKVREVIRKLV